MLKNGLKVENIEDEKLYLKYMKEYRFDQKARKVKKLMEIAGKPGQLRKELDKRYEEEKKKEKEAEVLAKEEQKENKPNDKEPKKNQFVDPMVVRAKKMPDLSKVIENSVEEDEAYS